MSRCRYWVIVATRDGYARTAYRERVEALSRAIGLSLTGLSVRVWEEWCNA